MRRICHQEECEHAAGARYAGRGQVDRAQGDAGRGLTSYQIVQKLMAQPELHGEITEFRPRAACSPTLYNSAATIPARTSSSACRPRIRSFSPKCGRRATPNRDDTGRGGDPRLHRREGDRPGGRAPAHCQRVPEPLAQEMRLQSDPTIIYGLVGGKGALDHPIQQEELDRETQYNTYKINGLPPTPIANPGRASIEAVLRPAKTKDLYFVADGTGGHVFSKLRRHKKSISESQIIKKEIRASRTPPRRKPRRRPPPAPARASAQPPWPQPNPPRRSSQALRLRPHGAIPRPRQMTTACRCRCASPSARA